VRAGEGPGAPKAVDIMCGRNMPVGRALMWCGWEVQGFDWARDPRHDMRSAAVRREILEAAAAADATVGAMDCSTLSRARERPILGHAKAPRPLRDAQHPEGLPGLTEHEGQRVKEANDIVYFFGELGRRATEAGAACVLENPLRAWFWVIRPIEQLLGLPGWEDFDYAACCFSGARAKRQRLRANVPELSSLRCECKHVHPKDVWLPSKQVDGSWLYPSSQEQ